MIDISTFPHLSISRGSQLTSFFSYSRAVYDCTVVLHFAGPNFKAYYRRGLALARLKLWQKAVLGQYHCSYRFESSLSRFSLQISNKLFSSNRRMRSFYKKWQLRSVTSSLGRSPSLARAFGLL